MTRVLYVNHSADLDGATQVLVNVISSLDSGEIDPLVLLPRSGPITERFAAAGIPYQIITIGHCNWDMYHVPMLQMLLREEKIDVIHANTLESYPAIVAAKLCGIPVVWHIHEMISHVQYYAHAFNEVDRKVFGELVSACARICTASEASKDAFVEYCAQHEIEAGDKVQAIHNGVTIPDATTPGGTPEKFAITGIGNMVSVKGWNYLIEAYAEILKDHPNVELTIVGKVFPGYFFDLYGIAEACGVADKVKFLTETANIEKVYLESDIIVCSSLIETFPMVVLEAMSYAKPVVATNVGGIKEMIRDRETGVLAPPGDATALAAGIKSFLDDWDRAVEIGKRARQTVKEDFSLAKQAQEFGSIYKDLAQARPSSLADSWSLEEIKQIVFAHMTGESEKIFRLEDRFGSAMDQQRERINRQREEIHQQRDFLESSLKQQWELVHRQQEQLENSLKQQWDFVHQQQENLKKRITQSEKLNSEKHGNIIRDLRALEEVVTNFLNQLPFRLMRRIKSIFRKS